MEKTKKAGISAGWAVAFTWFGSHCGSGFASGRQIVQYTTRHGIAGVWIPVAIWVLLGWFVYWAVEYARLLRAKNYKDFAMSFYGPIGRIIVLLLDIIQIIGTVIVLGAMYSAAGALFTELWGWNAIFGAAVMGVICLAFTVFAYEFFSWMSSYLTIPMIVLLLATQTIVLVTNWDNFLVVIRTSGMSAESGGIMDMLNDVMKYAGLQSGFYATAIALCYTFTQGKKDTKQAAIGGAALNGVMHLFNVLMMYSAYPWINGEALPTRALILQTRFPWMVYFYQIVLILAIVTTAIATVYGCLARYGDIGSKVIKSQRARYAIWALLFTFASIFVASAGLTAVVNKGYGLVGQLRSPSTVFPVSILGVWRIGTLKKQLRAEGKIDENDDLIDAPETEAPVEA